VPFVAWLGASTLQPIRVVLPKLQTPLADGFMGDVDAAFTKQLLHVAIAQGEAVVTNGVSLISNIQSAS